MKKRQRYEDTQKNIVSPPTRPPFDQNHLSGPRIETTQSPEDRPAWNWQLRHSTFWDIYIYIYIGKYNSTSGCNCRNKDQCPLGGQCLTNNIIYKATISTNNTNDTKHYIGMTTNSFKERYRNHTKYFQHKKYSNETELSKHIWNLKNKKQNFNINWSILKRSAAYSGGSNRCNLCLEEKLCIMKSEKPTFFNKKSEILSTCRHKNKFKIKNVGVGKNKGRNVGSAPSTHRHQQYIYIYIYIPQNVECRNCQFHAGWSSGDWVVSIRGPLKWFWSKGGRVGAETMNAFLKWFWSKGGRVGGEFLKFLYLFWLLFWNCLLSCQCSVWCYLCRWRKQLLCILCYLSGTVREVGTCFYLCSCNWLCFHFVPDFFKYVRVVLHDCGLGVVNATVTDFHYISVENFMEFVFWWEMFVD